MQVFTSTIQQMALLLIFMIIGYILSKAKIVPDNASGVLSKLENNCFTPASILGTFLANFTVSKLSGAWQYLLVGTIVVLVSIPIAMLVSKLSSKDDYTKKIYAYGLIFSNFGFMGNAVVSSVYGNEVYMSYLVFVIPFWIGIYAWAVPTLLMPSNAGQSIGARLKNLANPMLIATFLGMLIGISGLKMPVFITGAITSLGNCMSPIAMLLTGMAIAKIDLKESFKNVPIYIISIIRLIIIPLVAMGILYFIPMAYEIKLCAVCALAMPLGLSPIVIPAAYGLDTKVASAMALISHILSVITIPIVFMIFDCLAKL